MSVEEQAYPHASPDGKEIPYDVGDPIGLWIHAFTSAQSAEVTLPTTWETVVLYSPDEPLLVAFGDGVTVSLAAGAAKTNTQYIPAATPVSVRLPSNKFKSISVSGDSGSLYIQAYRRWRALSTEAQQTRID